jgi:hydrogenase maturation protein HypF
MLARGLNCPTTTSAGRWFDAVAGLLGLSLRQSQEAEAAIALERAAAAHVVAQGWPDPLPTPCASVGSSEPSGSSSPSAPSAPSAPTTNREIDLRPLLLHLLAMYDERAATGAAAAAFHAGLAGLLAEAAIAAAQAHGTRQVVLGGGCFCNRLLTSALTSRLAAAGLAVAQPEIAGPGDAGIAAGQAWAAAWSVATADSPDGLPATTPARHEEPLPCA